MTEISQSSQSPLDTLAVESISHELVPAAGVFFTAEQLEGMVVTAYDSGSIAAEEQGESPRHRITQHVGIDELDAQTVHGLTEMDVKYGKQGKLEDFGYKDPETLKQKVAGELRQQIVGDIVRNNGWYLQRQELRETIENGFISEAYALTIGDRSIPLVNFTDQTMTAEQVEDIRDALEKVANVTRGTVAERTNMIYIESPAKMGKNNGAAQISSGTIAINSDVLKGKFDTLNAKINTNISHLGSYLRQLTVHELGHLIDDEISDQSLLFKDALGWTRSHVDIAPDTPDPDKPYIISKDIIKRGTPSVKSKVIVNDELQEVSTVQHFGSDLYLNSKPVTKYGNTDHREDFAESFIPFVLDEDKVVLDALRHNAVANIVHDTAGNIEGNIHVQIAQIDPRTIIKDTLDLPKHPVSYSVKIMVDGQSSPSGGKNTEAIPKRAVSLPTWSHTTRKITDDYGNEVEARPRVLRI